LRVFDASQGTVITPDVVQIDTAREPFNVVAQNLKDISNRGIWLKPYRGIPQAGWIPALDIVYVDKHFRVLRCIENHRQGTINPPEIVNSALILPSGGANEACIQHGDQLELRDAASGLRWAGADAGLENEAAAERDRSTKKKGLGQVFSGLLNSIGKPSTRRKAKRRAIPGLVAYFPTARTSLPRDVKNISTEGFYLLTEERWTPGTSILVSLQIINPASQKVEAMITVPSKVVSLGPDGVGFTFDDDPTHRNLTDVEGWAQLRNFLRRIRN
jgi:PilZ domain